MGNFGQKVPFSTTSYIQKYLISFGENLLKCILILCNIVSKLDVGSNFEKAANIKVKMQHIDQESKKMPKFGLSFAVALKRPII